MKLGDEILLYFCNFLTMVLHIWNHLLCGLCPFYRVRGNSVYGSTL